MKDWTDRQIEVYYAGIELSDYPSVLWERMKLWLGGCASLTDVGCGPGAFALKALEEGFIVQAVDVNEKCLRALEGRINEQGYTDRCKLVWGDWLDDGLALEEADVCISAYSTGGGIGTRAGIAKIAALAKKVIFFITPFDLEKADFMSRDVYLEAGLKIPSFRHNYSEILRELESLGLEPEWQVIEYDFGMPLPPGGMDDCALFLQEKLGIPSFDQVRKHLEKIRTRRNGTDWIPNPKRSTLIRCKKRW